MNEMQTAYQVVALAVWQIVTEQHPKGLTALDPMRRVKVKSKRKYSSFRTYKIGYSILNFRCKDFELPP
jgi:hypothetical protein